MAITSLLLSLLVFSSRCASAVLPDRKSEQLPLVIWHGLGDQYDADGMQEVSELAEEVNPNTFVYVIRLDEDGGADRTASFFGNLTLQVEQVCQDLASHPILSTAPAINALGFSQGGQFLRAYIERCNSPKVASLVTFGSQHNGISEFKNCGATDWLCKGATALLRGNRWSEFLQSRVVPAQYYRDPEDLENYLEFSNFLASVNNERDTKNTTYRENLIDLERFVMYVFADDTTVVPKETGWFSEVNSTTKEVTKLQDRSIYKEDWLGLRHLDERNKLEFRTTPGEHMRLDRESLTEAFKQYFGPSKLKRSELSVQGEL
ncbi:MAG: hypothetical protein M1812_004066 [Candelaria pacifica]|nr:MAG: hypothetical protein M1812_004066 [Candelaria pacifica]